MAGAAEGGGAQKQWFCEEEALWEGQKFCIEYEEELLREQTRYQVRQKDKGAAQCEPRLSAGRFSDMDDNRIYDFVVFHVDPRVEHKPCEHSAASQEIRVLQSKSYGRVLVLDNVIQLTERDESAYHEMMAHVPLFCHKDPVSVLVIGGGDGGVVREVLKHASVDRVTLVDIDARVVEVVKEFFPSLLGKALKNSNVDIRTLDAAVYVREHPNEFDVIIVDSPDPVGAAESLFTESFYANLKRALRPNGILCAQGESMWLHSKFIKELLTTANMFFRHVEYATISIPSYPGGQIGMVIASEEEAVPYWLRQPRRAVPADMARTLKYYSEGIHEACFVLPRSMRNHIEDITGPNMRPEYHSGASIKTYIRGAFVVGLLGGALLAGAGAWAWSRYHRGSRLR